jgi:glucosyl-3-phosphoglycerate synthase
MADFHQSGPVATLHRLETGNLEALERDLEIFARRRPIALVLPCLFAEFSRPAIYSIIEELRQIDYLDTIVVSLAQATQQDLFEARAALSQLPQRVSIIWQDGPAVSSLYDLLRDRGLDPGPDGKGRGCWMAYGYLLAERRCAVIASHDCDITTYSRELLARLCYPVVHPHLDFHFAKGFYARVNGTLNGRVTRLFVGPLLHALRTTVGPAPIVEYFAGFRYPLAGEFAMTREVARASRLPANWGLEVGVLAEVFRHCGPARVCQTELCDSYEHKHQALSPDDPGKGLVRMCVEITQSLLRSLSSEGLVLSHALLRTLRVRYQRLAQDAVRCFEADSAINGLPYDRHLEEQTLEAFGRGLALACRRHADDPLGLPMMPSWERVSAALPEFLDTLRESIALEPSAIAAA